MGYVEVLAEERMSIWGLVLVVDGFSETIVVVLKKT